MLKCWGDPLPGIPAYPLLVLQESLSGYLPLVSTEWPFAVNGPESVLGLVLQKKYFEFCWPLGMISPENIRVLAQLVSDGMRIHCTSDSYLISCL